MDPSFVLVTGGLSGIGAAIVSLLLSRGLRVIAVDIAADPEGKKLPLWPYPVDVSDESAVATAVSAIEEELGPLTGLVNAAGVLGKMHAPQKLRMADWDREMAVDLRGTYLMCRAVGPRMASRGSGAIVNIASVVGMSSAPVHGYGLAKAAVIQMSTAMAAEWGPRGVRVNAVSPGFTSTPALEAGFSAGVLDAENLARLAALQRLVAPKEIAHAVVWLLGPEASGVTGANLPVDAGFLAAATWQAYGGLRKN